MQFILLVISILLASFSSAFANQIFEFKFELSAQANCSNDLLKPKLIEELESQSGVKFLGWEFSPTASGCMLRASYGAASKIELRKSNYGPFGNVSECSARRQEMIDRFNKSNGDKAVFTTCYKNSGTSESYLEILALASNSPPTAIKEVMINTGDNNIYLTMALHYLKNINAKDIISFKYFKDGDGIKIRSTYIFALIDAGQPYPVLNEVGPQTIVGYNSNISLLNIDRKACIDQKNDFIKFVQQEFGVTDSLFECVMRNTDIANPQKVVYIPMLSFFSDKRIPVQQVNWQISTISAVGDCLSNRAGVAEYFEKSMGKQVGMVYCASKAVSDPNTSVMQVFWK